jgi:hypothetical protein
MARIEKLFDGAHLLKKVLATCSLCRWASWASDFGSHIRPRGN